MPRMARRSLALVLLLAASCSMPESFSDLDEHCPPPEHGRPGWVRACAKVGAFVGAVPGAVFSVVALPITWPMTLIADEPLGKTKSEVMLFPLTACAAAGHFLLGTPADSVHWVCYRAWTEPPKPASYEWTPMAPPRGVSPETPASAPQKK
jgi:hypothetical protein